MMAAPRTPGEGRPDFEAEFDEAIRLPSEAAANAMLVRGRYIAYREADTPPRHVVREYPDRRREIVKVDLTDATRKS